MSVARVHSATRYYELCVLGKRGLTVWGYGRNKKFVCRLEVNAAGVADDAGSKGRKKVTNASWEKFVERLSTTPRRRARRTA